MEKTIGQFISDERKSIAVRGVQMLVIGFMANIGITIIGLLAFIQFAWMLFTREKNEFIADVGVSIKNWYTTAITFLTGNNDEKPFPWIKP